jgi:hypothetical protein
MKGAGGAVGTGVYRRGARRKMEGKKSGSSMAWKFRIWLRMADLGQGRFVS